MKDLAEMQKEINNDLAGIAEERKSFILALSKRQEIWAQRLNAKSRATKGKNRFISLVIALLIAGVAIVLFVSKIR